MTPSQREYWTAQIRISRLAEATARMQLEYAQKHQMQFIKALVDEMSPEDAAEFLELLREEPNPVQVTAVARKNWPQVAHLTEVPR